MTTPTRLPPNEPKTETSKLEVPNTEAPKTVFEEEAQSDAVIPSQSDAVIPSQSDAVIPSQSDAVIPSQSDAVIPSQSDAVIPSQSDAVAVLEPDPALSLEPKPVESRPDTRDPPEAGEDAPPKQGTFHSLVELIHDLAIAVVICVLLITYVVQAFKVQGTSMSPELQDGERILVNKFMYHFSDIARGDVVVFWYPDDPDLSFIKRIIALPGETVEIKSGDVFVDGVLIDEFYVTSAHADRRSHPSQEIRPGHYFVLGDNRRGSNDSRSWGLVPERYIYGKAFVRIWPLSDVGLVQ